MIKTKLMIGTAALLVSAAVASAQTERQPEMGAASGGQGQETQQPKGQAQQPKGQAQRGAQEQQRGQRAQGQAQQEQQGQRMQQGQAQQEQQGQRMQRGQAQTEQRGQRTQQGQAQKEQRGQRAQGQAQQEQKGQREQNRAQQNQDRTTGQAPSQGQRQGAQERPQGAQQQGGQRPEQGATQDRNAPERSVGQQQQGSQPSGQAARPDAQGRVQLSSEQRTRIQETVLSRNAPRVDRVDFALRTGVVVPSRVTLVDVPDTLVEINPAWRGNRFFVVQDQIIIVRPDRHIVAIVPVGGGGRAGYGGDATIISIEQLPPEEIRIVQEALVRQGFRVEVTGRFDDRTRDAFIQFKQRQGLGRSTDLDTRTVTRLGVQDRVKLQGGETTGSSREPGQTGAEPSRGSDQQRQQGGSARGAEQQQGGSAQGAGQQRQGREPGATSGQGSGEQEPNAAPRGNRPQGMGGEQGSGAPQERQRPEGSR